MILEFAISTTLNEKVPNLSSIKNAIYVQYPDIDNSLKSEFTKIILKNYLLGKEDAFTEQQGIRENINMMGRNAIIKVLLRNALINEMARLYPEAQRHSSPMGIMEKHIQVITEAILGDLVDNELFLTWLLDNDNLDYIISKYSSRPSLAVNELEDYHSSNPNNMTYSLVEALNSLNTKEKENIK